MAVEVETKQWGNSIGVIIPKELVHSLKIKPKDKITLEIKKENPLKELFGALKFEKSTEKIIKENRKLLESKWV